MEDFKKGDYITIELGGFGNRVIYCILNEVLDYTSGKPHRLVGYVYIYDNTLLHINKDVIDSIEIISYDRIRQCRLEELKIVNDILLKNNLIWDCGKNKLVSIKKNKMSNEYTVKAYIGESRYISDHGMWLLLGDLDGEFSDNSLEIKVVDKRSDKFICPNILKLAHVHSIIEFKLKGSCLMNVYECLGTLSANGIELLYLEIDNG